MADATKDQLGRRMHDLRISVTDRCNMRCRYCMPLEVFGPDYKFLPRDAILSHEEIVRVARASTRLGVSKLRITGGEPLLRRGLPFLVSELAAIEGIEDVALTTNGLLLPKAAKELKEAGLSRVTISLDSLDDDTFGKMNGLNIPVADVLKGIDAAIEHDLGPIKLNMVVQRGVNDHDILPMAEHFRGTDVVLRFIEFMDVGNSNGWKLDSVVPSREVQQTLHARWPLKSANAQYGGEVAKRWEYVDGQGEVGFISSVTNTFCGACTRARLSARGELFTCLFGSQGHDLKADLAAGKTDHELTQIIADVWTAREDRYSELRSSNTENLPKAEMSYLGG
ncbi:GTP 3',8-cyclase MoaA [Planctomycetota bacterium]|nr:GTP 3',8-cyclase MoaA [Planctomycetota bacterium]